MVATLVVCTFLMAFVNWEALFDNVGKAIGFLVIAIAAGTLAFGVWQIASVAISAAIDGDWNTLRQFGFVVGVLASPALAYFGFLGLCKGFDRFLIQRGM